MTNSREKGKVGEREWAEWLRAHGVMARRGVQHAGGPESPDVVSDLSVVHWEVKRQQRIVLDDAVGQARSEAAPGKLPVVAHRRNRGRWLLTVDAEDFWDLAAEFLPYGRVAGPEGAE